jgi:hypothetical protein
VVVFGFDAMALRRPYFFISFRANAHWPQGVMKHEVVQG